jgi:hypothetical protein
MKNLISVLVIFLAVAFSPLTALAAHSSYGCDGCHTPHHADKTGSIPLWSGKTTTATFTVYSSSTLDAVVGQPDGSSKLCLACHDGTDPAYSFMDPDRILGTDLSTSHPISFVYDATLATTDGGLKNPSENSTLGGTIAKDLLDGNGKVQCSSCHDIHSSGVGDNSLRGYDYTHGPGGGRLCQMCHNK